MKKKRYVKPQAEIVHVRCNEKLLWGEMGNESNKWNYYEAKEMEYSPEEVEEWEQWNDLFRSSRHDPWAN